MAHRVLISGASVAGPMLAHWLRRAGLDVTVVERTAGARTALSGHAVDLFGPAVDIAEWAGVLPAIEAARTHSEDLWWERPGRATVEVDVARLAAGMADRHVEVMRGELVRILHEHTRDGVEYMFGDSITSIETDADGVDVTFERGAPRRFDLVVGADGLHSNVRRLTFGPEEEFLHDLGGHVAVFSVTGSTPDELGPPGTTRTYAEVDRLSVVYPVRQTGQTRVVLLWRGPAGSHSRRDTEAQRRAVRAAFSGSGWLLPDLLERMEHSDDLYVDTISQVRMPTWSLGRVALVGDAGYSPGPAIGGGTSLAVLGAYLFAQELARAGGDPVVAFPAYERRLAEPVQAFQQMAPKLMQSGLRTSRAQVATSAWILRVWARLPVRLQRAISSAQGGPAKAFEGFQVEPPAA
ncbi:FAD-dependent monooxygenase [Pseudactinotalea sp.]|uniref:FAD-dependent monooxygenase n=1 Tax=Pseudactinotalea sp. TaxID=1926260 RepID=UPI003B3AC1B2